MLILCLTVYIWVRAALSQTFAMAAFQPRFPLSSLYQLKAGIYICHIHMFLASTLHVAVQRKVLGHFDQKSYMFFKNFVEQLHQYTSIK